MHPLNKNQLYYPGFNNAGGSGDPNGGTPILSTDFGDWTDLPEKSANIFDEQILIQYKLDLANYPTKAIVYLVGQFGLNPIFSGSEMKLGVLPEDTRPKKRIKQNFTVQATECYLIIETTGEILLFSVSGDLPVTIGETENDPYFINIDYNPDISDGTIVEEYTAVRSQNFTRNNCGNGYVGSTVLFSKTYKSNISQQAANDIADGDLNFIIQGQAFANDPENGSCTVIEPVSYSAQRTQSFSRNDCAAGEVGSAVPFTKNYISLLSQADADQKAANDPDFETLGQAYANDALNGATCTVMSGGETTYYAQRSQSFKRNNCGNGLSGTSVPFVKNYSSIISQIDANTKAANDADFITQGQAFANDPVNGATCQTNGTAELKIYYQNNDHEIYDRKMVAILTESLTHTPIVVSQNLVFDFNLDIVPIDGSDTVHFQSVGTILAGSSSATVYLYNSATTIINNLLTGSAQPAVIDGYNILTDGFQLPPPDGGEIS